jgi:hypothetical protein
MIQDQVVEGESSTLSEILGTRFETAELGNKKTDKEGMQRVPSFT